LPYDVSGDVYKGIAGYRVHPQAHHHVAKGVGVRSLFVVLLLLLLSLLMRLFLLLKLIPDILHCQVYSYFRDHDDVKVDTAVKHHPTTGYYENVFTVWLNGYRGIESVINNIGEATTQEGKPCVVPVYVGPDGVSNKHRNSSTAACASVISDRSSSIEEGESSTSSVVVSTPTTLRRSKRDVHSINVRRGNLTFQRRLQSLFFSNPTKNEYEAIILAGSRRSNGYAVDRKNAMSVQRATELHDVPIYVIDNFLTESELDYFDEKIKSISFERSFVDNMEYEKDDVTEDHEGNNEHGDEKKRPDDTSTRFTNPQHEFTSPSNVNKKKQGRKRKSRTILDDSHRTSTFHSFRKLQDSKISGIEHRVATLLGT
jgi:hypothetical protein